MSDELFKKIREGDESEARELFENMKQGTLRSAMVAIMARNNSHGIGQHVNAE